MTTELGTEGRSEQLDLATAADIGEKLASVLRTYQGVDELFAPNAAFDINVPCWRMQLHGVEEFISWLRGYAPHGYHIVVVRALPTATGVAVEVEGEYDHSDGHQFFRNFYLCDVEDGRVTDTSFWCTGDWDEETRAHYLAHVGHAERKKVSA